MSTGANSQQQLMFDSDTAKQLCLKAVNMGMTLRQSQLLGYDRPSGAQMLNQWFEVVCNRKQAGLDPLG